MKREALVQSRLRHPNIVLLVAMVFEEKNYGVILEYMKYGDLKEFLETFNTPWQFKLRVALDIAVGMCYLHEQKVVHGDLKIQNILIGDGFRAKVSLNNFFVCAFHLYMYMGCVCICEPADVKFRYKCMLEEIMKYRMVKQLSKF